MGRVQPNQTLPGPAKKTLTAMIGVTDTTQNSGTLIIDKIYRIDILQTGDDFSNVGYTTPGEAFIATGTTPTSWTNDTTVYKLTATIEVLQNTYNNEPTVEQYDIGIIKLSLPGNQFTEGKTHSFIFGQGSNALIPIWKVTPMDHFYYVAIQYTDYIEIYMAQSSDGSNTEFRSVLANGKITLTIETYN